MNPAFDLQGPLGFDHWKTNYAQAKDYQGHKNGLIFDFGVSLNQNKVLDIKCRWNYGDQYDDDYDDDYGDNYDDYYALNLIQLLMQNSHSLLLFSFSIL